MIKTFFKRLTWIVVVGVCLASFLPHIFTEYWLLDLFTHFKVQYAVLSLLLLVTMFLTRYHKKGIIGLLLISLIWNCFFIIPYYFNNHDLKAAHTSDVSVLSINLLSSNTDYKSVGTYLEKTNADVVVLLEFNQKWAKQLQPVLNGYMYKKLVPRSDNFGIALFSKIPMDLEELTFNSSDTPSIRGNFKVEKESVTIVATHPSPPISQAAFHRRNQQLNAIIENKHTFQENLIVIGDFNMSSFSPHFMSLTAGKLYDTRVGFGLLPTWPASIKLLQTTLDHCLVSKNINIMERTVGENIGSDHLPVFVKLNITTN